MLAIGMALSAGWGYRSWREAELAKSKPEPEKQLELAEWRLAEIEIRTETVPPQDDDPVMLQEVFEQLRSLAAQGKSSAIGLIPRVLQRKGELLDRLGKTGEATSSWQLMAMLDKSTPLQVAIDRGHNLAKWGFHTRAMETLEAELSAAELDGPSCYRAACVLSIRNCQPE